MECLVEVKLELAEQYKKLVEESMLESAKYFLKNGVVTMKADAEIGATWYKAKG